MNSFMRLDRRRDRPRWKRTGHAWYRSASHRTLLLESLEQRRVLATIDLATLTAAQGSTIWGADAGDRSGRAVSSAGDVNGDGFDDILVGADRGDGLGNQEADAGEAYLIFGRATWHSTVDLANLGTYGVRLYAANSDDRGGFDVGDAGDVNGDGFDDVLVSAPYAGTSTTDNVDTHKGESYIVFGGSSLPTSINLATLDTAGVTIIGSEREDRSGWSVSGLGDINGDGIDDIIVGAPRNKFGIPKSFAGKSFVIFGNTKLPARIDLSVLDAQGVTIAGADAYDLSGSSISSAGDVNGDGFNDVIIGAPRAEAFDNAKTYAGESYIIFGRRSFPPTIDLEHLGSLGTKIFGIDEYDGSGFGFAVSDAGDINGDGFDDVLIGASRADGDSNSKERAGESYVVFGAPFLPESIDLAQLGSRGITVFGAESLDLSGYSLSGAGDINGDGFDDLLIGSPGADASGNSILGAGDSYVIFGTSSPPGTIDLSTQGGASITLFGAYVYDMSGAAVSGAGDANGDGFDDFLIGASLADASGDTKSGAGESYLIFGGNFTASTTHLGTAAAETLTGSASANVMNGGRENDTLIGNGGPDVLIGGQGGDTLAISDLTFQRIVGGTGSDTLRLDGSGLLLDLTSLPKNRLEGIEQVDLRGSGDNRLALTVLDLLNLSDESNSLIVHGNSGDSLVLDDGWMRGADEIIHGSPYRVFTLGAATLKVAPPVAGVPATAFTIDLASLEAHQGITFFGTDAGDRSGLSVSIAGDVNGDGFDDVIIGASRSDGLGNGRPDAGETYLVFGSPSLPSDLELFDLGSAGVTFFGVDANDNSGFTASGAGDVNGDGFDDLIIGAHDADGPGNTRSDAGDSYVIFGRPSFPPTVELSRLGDAGITIFGENPSDRSGVSVRTAGDVNGDGFSDLVIGADLADSLGNSRTAAGNTYVLFGNPTPPESIDLAIPDTADVIILGADAYDASGLPVSSAGDINGDGFDDLLIGAHRGDAADNAKYNAGDTYVIFGGASLPPVIDLADFTAGITIHGADPEDMSGASVSGVGDVNGDGFDDLIIGGPRADAANNATSRAGESYLLFGGASLPAAIDLASPHQALVAFLGIDQYDSSGVSVSGLGDVNGDGFDDIIIGASSADGIDNEKPNAGESYLIFGNSTLPSAINLKDLIAAGITIFGADAGDLSGEAVGGGGDLNGDGFDEVLIGAWRADALSNAKSYSGDSYAIFGSNGFTSSLTHWGSATDDRLVGTSSNDVMNGGRGDDNLIGNGGADILIGGHGNDVLTIGDLSFKRLAGGTGNDTLRLDGNGLSLDITTLSDNRLLDIEAIDLKGRGDNSVKLGFRDVLRLSGSSNTLVVLADPGDMVHLDPGWTHESNQLLDGVMYLVLAQGAAILKVPQSLAAHLNVRLAPETIELSNDAVPENAAAYSFIGRLTTTDPNAGDTHTYSLVTAGPGNMDFAFRIVGDTLETTTSLDYESRSSYTLRIRSTDSSGMYVERDFLIQLIDRNDAVLGDSNYDGIFNSADLVIAFQAGEYEDLIVGNSIWEDGDWNGDGDFDTSDLVLAFQGSSYEVDARVADGLLAAWSEVAQATGRRHGFMSGLIG
jgi:hypothetical protein